MNNKLLNLSHSPRKTFGKHFLHSVHCVVELAELDARHLLDVEDKLARNLQYLNYSRKTPLVDNSVTVSLEGSRSSIEHSAKNVGLSFSGDNPKFELQITPSGILYSDYAYTGFENFKSTLNGIVDKVVSVTEKTKVNRVGLRKINSFLTNSVSDLSQLTSVFNPALFGVLRSGIADVDSAKFFEDSFVIERNGKTCRLVHGMRRLSEGDKFEMKLDFDIINSNAPNIQEIFDTELDALNDLHFDIFMWSVTSDLIQLMESSHEQ